jgi:sugar phosphate isomerase/epimerase
VSQPISRRHLFGATAATLAGAALGGPAGAIDPIKRAGPARMRLSLAAYSYRDYLTNKREPHMTVEQFVERAATYPIDAVELTEYYWPKPISADYLLKVKRQCYLAGLDISGSPMGNVFTHPAGADRDKEVGRVKEWIDWCALLGVPAIRIFAGNRQKDQSLADAKKAAIETIEAACEHAGKKGVILALENHGGIVAEAGDLLDIVKAVKSPWFGINLDTGNFHTDDPYGDLAKCAPYAVTCQVKTEISGRGKPKEQADLKREIQILRDAGYRGYVTLEYEAAEDPLEAVPVILATMSALI